MKEAVFVQIIRKFSDDNVDVWYNDHVGEIFEVIPYRHNPKEYYERVDRQDIMNKRSLTSQNYPVWDFFILKKLGKLKQ